MKGAREPAEGDWLVADIGGTHLRAGLSAAGAKPREVEVLSGADYPDLQAALAAYLAATGANPVAACLAVAAPIAGDEVRFTNRAWHFSRRRLQRRLGVDRLLVLNDFEALALALPTLKRADLTVLGPQQARARRASRSPLAVLGPGTGLGVATLVPHGDGWIALAGEGGHAGFAPQDDLEFELAQIMRRETARLNNESILSGPGLSALYRALAVVDGAAPVSLAPAQVSARALDASDLRAVRAVDVFCAVLGAVAGDVALITGARGGVYIGGGIAPRLAPLLEKSRFRARFEDKAAQRDYVSAIPTWLIRAPVPALAGAVEALRADS